MVEYLADLVTDRGFPNQTRGKHEEADVYGGALVREGEAKHSPVGKMFIQPKVTLENGDVTLLDGNFTFGGNVTPNGNDGYLVFKRGDIQVGSIRMVYGRGHNSRVIVNSGATVRCAGDVFESGVHTGNPFHLYVDGTLSVDGVLSPYNWECSLQSPGGTGVLNAHAVDAGGTTFAVPTLNVGAGGAACAGTKFNGATNGCYHGDATFTGSYSFGAAAPVLRASTVDGEAADITLQGARTTTATIAKTTPSGTADRTITTAKLSADGSRELASMACALPNRATTLFC